MRLRRDFCLGGLQGLPSFSLGWRPTLPESLALLAEHGYRGVVAWEGFAEIRAAGLIPCGMGRVRKPDDAMPLAMRHRDEGLDFTTLHVGTGFETDAEMDRLAGAVLEASAATGQPLHVETHRATMTQDMQRSLELLKRFPELPLTLDFSHWYTGQEMTYDGELAERLARLDPVFANVRSIEIRPGTSGRIQTAWDPANARDHALALRRCLEILKLQPAPPAVLSVAPELLPAKIGTGIEERWIHYGDDPECTDRFADALSLSLWSETIFATPYPDKGALYHV